MTRTKWFLCVLLLLVGSSIAVTNSAGKPKAQVLIIAVDAIPYRVAKSLMQAKQERPAAFKGMHQPIALINAFPANSDLAWTALLEPFGIARPMGYEARYFDKKKKIVIGGDSLIEPHSPWKDFFDWRLKGVVTGAIAYGWPKKFSIKEFKTGLDAFSHSTKPVFSIYIISTDGVGHIYGPRAQRTVLETIAGELARFRKEHPDRRFHTMILSDHGMAGDGRPLKNTWIDVRRAIRKAGFRLRQMQKEPEDAVMIPYGLLSSFVIYSHPEKSTELARAVVQVPGIDLCVTAEKTSWMVHNGKGRARIDRRYRNGHYEWRYQVQDADPLSYLSVIKQLQRTTAFAKASWFADDLWLRQTRHHYYPDALYRISRAFSLVKNPASVVCSVAPGHMFGALTTEYVARMTIGRLRWTHGALDRQSSLGFVLHDLPDGPRGDVMRFNQVLQPLLKYGRKEAMVGENQ
ncbi:MAG TPA: hypothetical protein ENG78_00820 [Acidiferrobacteraceae bacterium]|nr:hypothetical protein [Acidiferrobacteraceae bacterium]HEX19359.1 hypothetical protein [Acidiferrobacteraceae bacterium]